MDMDIQAPTQDDRIDALGVSRAELGAYLMDALEGYVEALLWTEGCRGQIRDGDHECFGENCDTSLFEYYDATGIAAEAASEILRDVKDFVVANWADLQEFGRVTGRPADHAGHDFLLTRNGHGAGFWDRGAGAVGERLSKASKVYGEQSAYVGDDGKVYVQG